MELHDTRTHILVDSVRRLARQAAWYRRQVGRKQKDYVRIANQLTDHAMTEVEELRQRAKDGDEAAQYMIDHLPQMGEQREIVPPVP